jgi:hypothetical protein
MSRNCYLNQKQLALPSTRRGNTRGSNQSRNNSAAPYGQYQANNINYDEAQDQPATVMGTLLVNSVPASVLFDSGASLSFMSEAFAYAHSIRCENMDVALLIKKRRPMSNLHDCSKHSC